MIVILHNIRSLHNVGSIFRTADAVGVEKIYLTGITPAPVDEFGKPRRQFVKVSLGAERYVRCEKVNAAGKLLDALKKQDCRIFAIEQSAQAIPYYKAKLRGIITRDSFSKLALILGSETRGLPPAILKQCDKILEIPMRGKKESLNVAVAFGIVVYALLN